jgi:bifunctional DNA-binding transcriptional regulator/antitoxin component of YhaV-PrlF toxin-antitoxin module
LVIPREVRERLKINESTFLIFDILDQNTIKIHFKNYNSLRSGSYE